MILISSKLYEIAERAYKSKRWKWKQHEKNAPRGSGDLEDEWCDYLRDDLGIIIDYCEDSFTEAFELLEGKGGCFLDESKKKPHDQFLACLNPRNPDPENFYSLLIFPKELADKVLALGFLPTPESAEA